MSQNTYLRQIDNRSYASQEVVPFLGVHNNQPRYLYVYVIHCLPTNEWYIGKHTCRSTTYDPLVEGYKGSGHLLKQRKKQYNWPVDFQFIILEFCHNQQQLIEREQYYIKQYIETYDKEQVINCIYHNVGERQSYRIIEYDKPIVVPNQLIKTSFKNRFFNNNLKPIRVGVDGGYRFMYVYKITCIPTGQFYIGQHCSRLNAKNPLVDRYKGSSTALNTLIKQFDWYNDFTFEIIEFCDSYEQLFVKESQQIIKHKQQYNDLCLNNSFGNEPCDRIHMKKYRNSDQYRQRQRELKLKHLQEHPEVLEQNRQTMRQLWKDPEFRALMMYNAKVTGIKRSLMFKQHPELLEKIGREHSKQLIVLNDFTSPLNNKVFKQGTIFKSTFDCAKHIGFSHERSVTNSIVNNKKHPMQWWSKINGLGRPIFIVSFAYVDELTDDQKQQLAIQ